ncbi:MAG: ATP phosphoribosyltransferase regulatory subunit [Firmicutes bacterium]|nr:ATP phosphoribosyltransferase regulatory subunit [Bacillota bacterium]
MIKNFIPEGVADLNCEEYEKMNLLEESVVKVFKNAGYRQIMTPTFEYYDLFAEDNITAGTEDMYKIMDSGGKLMVLKPDATIPIARMVATHYKASEGELKLMYVTNVFRSADFRAGEKREFKQAGIEYFGANTPAADANVIKTAVSALTASGFSDLKTELGDADYFNGLMEYLAADERFSSREIQTHIRELVEAKNIPALYRFADEYEIQEKAREVLLAMPMLYGDIKEVTEKARALSLNDTMKKAVENITAISSEIKDINISADMGLVNRLDYYSGMIFKIYLKNSGVIAGSGGRYDKLMKKFGKNIPAAGFGLNMDILYEAFQKKDANNSDVLSIALGKGRLADTTVKQLEAIGITFPDYSKESRKLIFEDSTGKIRIVFVKAVDVGIYVEKGACDVGVIGKDTLLESGSDVFELLDLEYGKCIFAVASRKGFKYNPKKKLRVATKYPRVAKDYFAGMGRSIEIIKINGSVELAPLIGLSDVIVDIVETGKTLKENGLEVVEEITDISARFIVNRASLKTKETAVANIMKALLERN